MWLGIKFEAFLVLLAVMLLCVTVLIMGETLKVLIIANIGFVVLYTLYRWVCYIEYKRKLKKGK